MGIILNKDGAKIMEQESGLSYELRSWAMLVEGTGGLNRTEVMRKAADRIDQLEAALSACLPYMKYPVTASAGLIASHDKALDRARAALASEAAPDASIDLLREIEAELMDAITREHCRTSCFKVLEWVRAKIDAVPALVSDDAKDAARYEYVIDCDYIAAKKHLPHLSEEEYKAKLRKKHDAQVELRKKSAAAMTQLLRQD